MKSKTDLFDLIKTLTQGEKRYISLHCFNLVRSPKNNYQRLFDIISKMEVYDEGLIRQKFRNENFIKQLSVAKYELYRLILKSLREYRSEDSSEAQITFTSWDARTLFEQGLYRQGAELLAKAKQLAYRYENFPQLARLIHLEKRFVVVQWHGGVDPKVLDDLDLEEAKIQKLSSNLTTYGVLYRKVAAHCQIHGLPRTQGELETFRTFLKAPILRSEALAESFSAKIFYYSTQSLLYTHLFENSNAYPAAKALIQLIEGNPFWIRENRQRYLAHKSNLIGNCIEAKYYAEAFGYIRELKDLDMSSDEAHFTRMRGIIFRATSPQELRIYTLQGEFDKSIALIPVIEEGITKNVSNTAIDFIWQTYYSIAVTLLFAGRYRESLVYLNKILNTNAKAINDQTLCYARILSLIVHFELGNHDLLEYVFKSTYRFLSKRNKIYQFENIILDFINKKVPKIQRAGEQQQAFSALREKLISVEQDPLERTAIRDFSILPWLESKVSGKRVEEVLKSITN